MRIAILGAESTGKTQLAHTLVQALNTRGSASMVAEVLREWCALHDRTPQPHEQLAIAQAQALQVQSAAPVDFLIADTSALMTAVYSDLLFHDASLYSFALEQHRCYDLTLLTGLDLPWKPDGVQRDGPHSQAPVDARLRQVLDAHAIPYAVVYGVGPERTQCALQAIDQHLQLPQPGSQTEAAWQWTCEKCSDAVCEHRLFSRLLQDQRDTDS